MKFAKNIFIIFLIPLVSIFTAILCFGLILYSFLDPFFRSACRNELISTNVSPDGNYEAHIFIRDCGATTDYSYQLSILKVGKEVKNRSGNTFASDGEFTVEWIDDQLIKVSYSHLRTYDMDKQIGLVSVEYVYE
jgi:hypothetical protein